MPTATVSSRMLALSEEMRMVTDCAKRPWRATARPDACDFMFGNPRGNAVARICRGIDPTCQPRDAHWFGYKKYETSAREAVARSSAVREAGITSRMILRSPPEGLAR